MEDALGTWLNDPMVAKFAAAAVGILAVVMLVRLLNRGLGRLIQDADARYRARKATAFLGYLIGILAVAAIFSNQFGAFTVAFGVAGAGIAFALQEVIASVAGWVAIVFGRFFKIGDRVLLGGVRGDVIDIGVLRTTVMECGDWVRGDLYNGRIVRIANSFVFKEPVYNYSADFPFLWDEIVIPIRYGSDAREARAILERVTHDVVGEFTEFAKQSWRHMVSTYRIENASVEPLTTLTADENWMTFTVRYVVDFKGRRLAKDKLFTKILEAFAATGGRVQIASTSMEVSLVNPPPT